MPSKKKAPAKTQAAKLMELAKKAKGDNNEGRFAKQVGRITMATEARKATKMK
jgi:hypothetical protein